MPSKTTRLALSTYVSALLVISGSAHEAKALNIEIAYTGPGTDFPLPGSVVRPEDPDGSALLAHLARAAADWEDLILDDHTMQIAINYVPPEMTSTGTANAITVRFDTLPSGAKRVTQGHIVLSSAYPVYYDPDPTNDDEFTPFTRLTADSFGPSDLSNHFTIDTELVPALEVSHQAIGRFGNGVADLLSVMRHELGHFVGINQQSAAGNSDGDYDVPTALTGSQPLEINGIGHFEAPGTVMTFPLGVRANITATDILAAATGSEWTDLDLKRVDFARTTTSGGELTYGNPRSWVGGAAPNEGDEVFIANGAQVLVGDTLNRIGAMTIRNGSQLRMSMGTMNVSGPTTLGENVAASTGRLRVDDNALFNGDDITIHQGSLVQMNGGELRGATITNSNFITGDGVINVVLLENQQSGTVQALGGTLTITGPTLADPFFDLGAGQTFLDARSGNLSIAIPHSTSYNGRIEVNGGRSLSFHNEVSFAGSQPLALDGESVAEAVLAGPAFTISRELTADQRARINGDVTIRPTGNIALPDSNDRLRIDGNLDLLGSGDVLGDGELQVDGKLTLSVPASRLEVGELSVGEGLVIGNGTVTATDIVAPGRVQQNGGVLTFAALEGTLLQEGGDLHADEITISEDYRLGQAGRLVIDGFQRGGDPALQIGGEAMLLGTLDVSVSGTLPTPGETFQLLVADQLQVGDLAFEGPTTDFFEMIVTDEALLLRAIEFLDGDYNRDGRVDAADYTVWRDQFGQVGDLLAADGDGDGDVDDDDYTFWTKQYGTALAAISVPEPASAGVLMIAFGSWVVASRCRH